MEFDDKGLYFLAVSGKNFYKRLKENSHIAFTGMKGKDRLSSVAVSVQGKVREIGSDLLTLFIKKNKYRELSIPQCSQEKYGLSFKCIKERTNGLICQKKLIEH